MGIDVYMEWKGQTEVEKEAQITGWSVAHGHVGYLREAYHGGPYATQVLVPEGWQGSENPAIPAATLRERLPATVFTALCRHELVYGDGTKPGVFEGEAEMAQALRHIFEVEVKDRSASEIAQRLTDEQLRRVREMINSGNLPSYAKAFVDFVKLAEAKEKETGHPVTVIVSA